MISDIGLTKISSASSFIVSLSFSGASGLDSNHLVIAYASNVILLD